MYSGTRDVDITKNLKVIDWLKAELVTSVGALMKAMSKGSEGLILECITGILITTYILGKRLGMSYARIDMNMRSMLRENLSSDHEVEKWYGDLSGLLKYMEDSKK